MTQNTKHSLLILIITSLFSCSPPADTDIDRDHFESAIEVTDFSGKVVRLSQPAERIISLAPHITENIFSAGAGNNLVGVVAYSDYPEQASSLPLVGGYTKTNVEAIIDLKPDLVIAWESGNSMASVEQIRLLGFPVYIDQPDTLEDIAKSLRDIGALTGHSAVADQAATDFLAKIDVLRQRYSSKHSIRTFYQVWNTPLQTINGEHIISDAIELCGGVNIYADEAVLAPIINIESILQRDPDAIVASGMSDARPEWLDDWQQWPSLTAVQQDNLFYVDPDHIQRHTVRILLGIEAICEQFVIARARRNLP